MKKEAGDPPVLDIVSPDLLRPDAYPLDDYRRLVERRRRKWETGKLAVELARSGEAGRVIERAASNLSLASARVAEAEEAYRQAQLKFEELTDVLRLGCEITVEPTTRSGLNVWHWAGSEYTERHEIVRVLGLNEGFTGRSLRWDDTDNALQLYNTAVAGDTRGKWVVLKANNGVPNFTITDVKLPEIRFVVDIEE